MTACFFWKPGESFQYLCCQTVHGQACVRVQVSMCVCLSLPFVCASECVLLSATLSAAGFRVLAVTVDIRQMCTTCSNVTWTCQMHEPQSCMMICSTRHVAAADLHLSQVSIWSAVLPMTSSKALSTFQVSGGAHARLKSSPAPPAATDLTTSCMGPSLPVALLTAACRCHHAIMCQRLQTCSTVAIPAADRSTE